ncbi:MAG: DNA cytosine methyltransferase [Tropicimonas sp.]|uniref:DNA cytosine methyltransferase n=1 Tax=Tropicimonas sp. TaxID=2067044 RepID=UPI003A861AF0
MSGQQPAKPIIRKSVELFAGAGGLGIGLADAGFIPQMVVEYDRWCCDTLRDNHPVLGKTGQAAEHPWKVVEGDVRLVDFREDEGKLDLISGGPPCQPLSRALQLHLSPTTDSMSYHDVDEVMDVGITCRRNT